MKQTLVTSLAELEPAPERCGFRLTPPQAPDKGHGASPTFDIPGDELWRIWLVVAARQPRTELLAQNAEDRRSVHVQRSRVFRYPDFVRAEIINIEPRGSSIAIDSRSRFGYYDFGVNRRRVQAWIALLAQAVQNAET